MSYCNQTVDEIDYWIMHQANKIMNETIRIKTKVPKEKVPYSLENFGNTSSASIPLTMVIHQNKEVFNNKKLLLSGFGVGLSWANLILKTKEIEILNLIEV